jgi:hypothetical protein
MSAAFQIVLKRRSSLADIKTVKKVADAGCKHYIIGQYQFDGEQLFVPNAQ